MAADEAREQTDDAEGRDDGLQDNPDIEALRKQNDHATRKITELGQQRAESEARNAELQARLDEIEAQQAQYQQQTQSQDYATQLAERLESGDGMTILETMAYIANQAADEKMKGFQPQTQRNPNDAQVTAALARQELAAKYEDWGEISPKIGELLQEDPGLFTATAETPLNDVVKQLDRAYRLAKAETGWQGRDAVNDSLAETNRLIKNQAQTMSGQSQRQDAETMWDKIKASDGALPSFRDVK